MAKLDKSRARIYKSDIGTGDIINRHHGDIGFFVFAAMRRPIVADVVG